MLHDIWDALWSSSAEHPRDSGQMPFGWSALKARRSEAQNPVTRSLRKSTSAYTLWRMPSRRREHLGGCSAFLHSLTKVSCPELSSSSTQLWLMKSESGLSVKCAVGMLMSLLSICACERYINMDFSFSNNQSIAFVEYHHHLRNRKSVATLPEH